MATGSKFTRWVAFTGWFTAFIAAIAVAASTAAASDPQAFFAKRQVNLVVGNDAGSSYDLYARVLANHLPRHLPGKTTFVVQNMPGAGGIKSLNHLYTSAEQDGSEIGTANSVAPSQSLFVPEQARYDSRKFHWIGSVSTILDVVAVWHDAPIKTFDDVFKSEFLVGGTGGSGTTIPRVVNATLGTKFKIVGGYKASSEVYLAMQRGEVQGIGDSAYTTVRVNQADLLKAGKVRIIAHFGFAPRPDLPDIPSVVDYAKTDEQKAMLKLALNGQELGRFLAAPPKVPEPIVQAYRTAFDATMKDEQFIADMQSKDLEFDPRTGEQIQAFVAELYETPPEVIKQVYEITVRK